MRLVTYNIQYGIGLDGRYGIGRIAEAVRGADVIALQEVCRNNPRNDGRDMVAARSGGGGAKAEGKAPMPWFVLGFIAMIGLNSLDIVPAEAAHAVTPVTTFLLTMALAAMGLETHIRKLKAKGARPLALGALSWLFISAFSLALILTIG